MTDLVACVDFGSTYTKALLVSTGGAEVVAAAEHQTTSGTDVMEGWLACRAQLGGPARDVNRVPVLACSSAGGGLRVAVVGNEELVTAEAGRRIALSSGGRVVYVGVDGLMTEGLGKLLAASADIILLVGGTDDGNAEVILAASQRLAAGRWAGPVVVAGNRAAAAEVSDILTVAGVDHQLVDNVVPRIGVLQPEPARAAIRAVFLRHVIGGKHLSASADFEAMIVGPTPDVVLSGVELLAARFEGGGGGVVVVDVGGATTDVYSVVEIDPEDAGLGRQVVAPTAESRTVEADLGMRLSAQATVEAALEAGLLTALEIGPLAEIARTRTDDVSHVPNDPTDHENDLRLAELAMGLALRRHSGRRRVVFGPDGRALERTGKDLREVALLVGSGGVLRHAVPGRAEKALRRSTGGVDGGWLLPASPRVVIDSTYVLAAAGLLRGSHADAAGVLVDRYVIERARR